MSNVAFIPARGGSARVPRKNLKPLQGHPLIAYTIASAQQSKVFDHVYVATDDPEILKIAEHYGAEPVLRPVSEPEERDIEWVTHTFRSIARNGVEPHSYAIVRPTSPFRQPKDIRTAWEIWERVHREGFTSLRAVEKCSEHPAKMWRRQITGEITPLLLQPPEEWHSTPYQVLPDVYIQNAALEISLASVAIKEQSITGKRVYGFLMTGDSGFDINHEYDWDLAEAKVKSGVRLPKIEVEEWHPA